MALLHYQWTWWPDAAAVAVALAAVNEEVDGSIYTFLAHTCPSWSPCIQWLCCRCCRHLCARADVQTGNLFLTVCMFPEGTLYMPASTRRFMGKCTAVSNANDRELHTLHHIVVRIYVPAAHPHICRATMKVAEAHISPEDYARSLPVWKCFPIVMTKNWNPCNSKGW